MAVEHIYNLPGVRICRHCRPVRCVMRTRMSRSDDCVRVREPVFLGAASRHDIDFERCAMRCRSVCLAHTHIRHLPTQDSVCVRVCIRRNVWSVTEHGIRAAAAAVAAGVVVDDAML